MAKKVENNVGQTLNTDGIVKAMAQKSKDIGEVVLSQKECNAAIGYLKDVVQEYMATGGKVQITGFLTIQPSYRAERKGNNVVTGQPMNIPESVTANIKMGKSLRDAMHNLDKSIVEAVRKSVGK